MFDYNQIITENNYKYDSIGQASKETKIPPKTIHNRLNSNNKKYSNYLYVDKTKIPKREEPKCKKPIKIGEEIFCSMEEAIKKYGCSRPTLWRALKGIPTRTFKNIKIEFIWQ